MVYTHGSHVPSDSLIGDILTRSRRRAPPFGSLSDAPSRGRRGYFARRVVRRRGGHRAAGFRGGRGGG